jgi:hypothetical protein
MDSVPISIGIPVGPNQSHKQWLGETIDSICSQTVLPKEIVLIDDQAHLSFDYDLVSEFPFIRSYYVPCGIYLHLFSTPWLSGPTVGFNYSVALSTYPHTIMLGSDDILYPQAVEEAWNTVQKINDPLGYYNFSCQTSQGVITWYNNAACVTKKLWKEIGGFHPFTVTGGMDAAFLSIMMVHFPSHMHKIKDGIPLYFVREHAGQYTQESASKYPNFMVQLRNDLTREWVKPTWTTS